MHISRRAALVGAAAATAGSPPFVDCRKAHAAGAAAAAPTGVFRYKFGDGEIIQLRMARARIRFRENFVTNSHKEQTAAALEAQYMPKGQTHQFVQPGGHQDRAARPLRSTPATGLGP